MTLAQVIELEIQIRKIFNGVSVTDAEIDGEFGNVTATVDGQKYVDCGFIEDYKL